MKKLAVLCVLGLLASACQKENVTPKLSQSLSSKTDTSSVNTGPTATPSPVTTTPPVTQPAPAPKPDTLPPPTGTAALLNGRYAGYYTGTIFFSDPNWQGSLVLTFSANKFDTYNSTLSYWLGTGIFTGDNNSLTFANTVPYATPGGNPDPTMLNGNYNYTIKGDSLLINKMVNGSSIIFKLKKQ